jgi:rhodanese-related sulfurtransferase
MPDAVRQFIRLGLLWLTVGIAITASANPNDYPEYAQIKIAQDIQIDFITAEDVKQRLDAGAPQVIIDVRDSDHFQKTHLPGAISIPLRSLETRGKEIPRETPVVLYCACPHHLASLAYQYLYRLGYRNIRVLKEGLPGWQERHYPIKGTSQHAGLPGRDHPSL